MPEGRADRGILAAGLMAVLVLIVLLFIGARDYSRSAPSVRALVDEASAEAPAGIRVKAVGGEANLLVRPGSSEGRTLFDGVLEDGQARVFPAQELWLRVRNRSELVVESRNTRGAQSPSPGLAPAGPDGGG